MARPQLRRLVHPNLGDRVYKAIRDLISGQIFPPGSKLNVEQLCRDLGVSRTPVWDAMKRLETEGLVETVPRQGVFVLNFSVDKVREIYAVREVLEGLAARWAAERLGQAEVAALDAVIQRQAAAVRALDFPAYSRADLEFHGRVLAAARNHLLSRQLESVYGQMLVLRLRTLNLPERIHASFAEHTRVFEAVAARDPERAEAAARTHVRMVMRDAMQELPELEPADGSGRPAAPRSRRSAQARRPWPEALADRTVR